MTIHKDTENYTVKCVSGRTRFQNTLAAAFKRVADPLNWKNSIGTLVRVENDSDMSLLRDAIIHFTGSVPTFTANGRNLYYVTADGYYATIGA